MSLIHSSRVRQSNASSMSLSRSSRVRQSNSSSDRKSPTRRRPNTSDVLSEARCSEILLPQEPIVDTVMLHRGLSATETRRSKSLCKVTMHYYGIHVNLQGNGLVREQKIKVEQQPGGSGTLAVFNKFLEAPCDFTFKSHRHRGCHFALTFYIDGIQSGRLSKCCEYACTELRINGPTGPFGVRCISGGVPCYNCKNPEQDKKQSKLPKQITAPTHDDTAEPEGDKGEHDDQAQNHNDSAEQEDGEEEHDDRAGNGEHSREHEDDKKEHTDHAHNQDSAEHEDDEVKYHDHAGNHADSAEQKDGKEEQYDHGSSLRQRGANYHPMCNIGDACLVPYFGPKEKRRVVTYELGTVRNIQGNRVVLAMHKFRNGPPWHRKLNELLIPWSEEDVITDTQNIVVSPRPYTEHHLHYPGVPKPHFEVNDKCLFPCYKNGKLLYALGKVCSLTDCQCTVQVRTGSTIVRSVGDLLKPEKKMARIV